MAPRLSAPHVLTIADLRTLARKRLPQIAFDYIDGGSDGEVTLRENIRAFEDIVFRPRCAVASSEVSLQTTVAGTPLALPILFAPVGSSRLFYPRAEEAAAKAAGDAGTAYVLSTFGGTALEEVSAATRGPVWYQLYLAGTRDVSLAGIERARAAGFGVLMVTIDTPVAGHRVRDMRNGLSELIGSNPFAKVPHLGQILRRPRWLAGFYGDGGLMSFPNVVLPGKGPMHYDDVAGALSNSSVCWDDLEWIREVWDGPIVIKGIYTADDARRAVDAGAAAIVVSNHGGRQLDGVAASIRILPEVVAAVGEQTEVLFDSGIRRGGDVAKALCLGARAVLVGRAYMYGVAAGGNAGATRAIEILREEVIRTLRLLGVSSVDALDRSLVDIPEAWNRSVG